MQVWIRMKEEPWLVFFPGSYKKLYVLDTKGNSYLWQEKT